MRLPDDLTREILLKLPCFKSARRLSCVSKSWHRLIKDPKYKDELFNNIKNHFNVKNDDSQMVFLRQKVKISGNPNYEYFVLPKSPDNCQNAVHCPVNVAKIEVVGSCNGILCFGESGPGLAVHLYNPITREHRKLPPSPIGARTHVPDWRGDGKRKPSLSRHRMLGFGYDSSSSDYKVVCIWGRQDAEVYNLGTNSWTRVYPDLRTFRFTIPDHTNFCPGALVNGCFHWLQNDKNRRILTFDFVSERFGDLLFPDLQIPLDEENYTYVRLTLLDDSLALWVSTVKMTEKKTRVWVMTEPGNERSWVCKFSMKECSCQDLVAGWIDDDDNLVMLMYAGILITCPPMAEQGGEEAKGKLSRLDRAEYVRATLFRPSLVSLHTFGGRETLV